VCHKGGEQICVDALAERIDTVPRTIDGATYLIWTQKRDVRRLSEVELLIAKKESSDEGEEPSVKYIVSNKIDAPASHLIEALRDEMASGDVLQGHQAGSRF